MATQRRWVFGEGSLRGGGLRRLLLALLVLSHLIGTRSMVLPSFAWLMASPQDEANNNSDPRSHDEERSPAKSMLNPSRPRSGNELAERNENFAVEDPEAFGGKSGLLLGKDKELFHASIDLKRAWSKLTDRESWVSLFRRVVKALSHVSGADDSQLIFKEIAIELLCDIRKHNPEANIKLFQGTIKQAENFARRTGRFIVVYIEDSSAASISNNLNRETRSFKASEQFRKAFAENGLGSLLNDQFVFFAGSTNHSPTSNIVKLLGFAKKDLPLFAILTPAFVDMPPSMEKKRLLPEIVVTLRLASLDIDHKKVQRFLQRVLEVHGPLLAAKKKDFDELLSAENALGGANLSSRRAQKGNNNRKK
jgi:hypothetical protein